MQILHLPLPDPHEDSMSNTQIFANCWIKACDQEGAPDALYGAIGAAAMGPDDGPTILSAAADLLAETPGPHQKWFRDFVDEEGV